MNLVKFSEAVLHHAQTVRAESRIVSALQADLQKLECRVYSRTIDEFHLVLCVRQGIWSFFVKLPEICSYLPCLSTFQEKMLTCNQGRVGLFVLAVLPRCRGISGQLLVRLPPADVCQY